MAVVAWRSWSDEYGRFELNRISHLPFINKWVNGYTYSPKKGDVLLTTNGHGHKAGHFIKATIYAEPYHYLKPAYDNWNNCDRWDVRFTFKESINGILYNLPGYWQDDAYLDSEKTHNFGMVLSNKPEPIDATDIGYLRRQAVNKLTGNDFIHWGSGWPDSQSYQGKTGGIDVFRKSHQHLSVCKFGLAFDNCKWKNYLSEKIWSCLAAGTIPIYYGHKWVKEVIDNDAFIYGYDFDNFDAIIDYCRNMSDDEYQYKRTKAREFFENDISHSWEYFFTQIDAQLGKCIQHRTG